MHELCTIVSSAFAPSSLVLYESLLATGARFRLRILCMDDRSRELLDRLELRNVQTVDRTELEAWDPALAEVATTRMLKEYCWTAKPSLCLYLLERGLDAVTYVDSDIAFHADPGLVLSELDGAAVLLFPQRMSPGWKEAERWQGAYNGGTISVRASDEGVSAVRWWRERCLEWCHARFEDGKWADQTYLDTLAQRFPGVNVAAHPGAAIAPWNGREREITRRGGRLFVDGEPLVFYHYASPRLYGGLTGLGRLRLLPSRYRFTRAPVPLVWSAWEKKGLTDAEVELLWKPYVQELSRKIAVVWRSDASIDPGLRNGREDLRRWLVQAARTRGRDVVGKVTRRSPPRSEREEAG